MAPTNDKERHHHHAGGVTPPRFQEGALTTALHLGPLASLVGSWRGPGFNAIWRPDNPESLPHETPPDQTKRFLELNLTNDSFDFHVIPGVVPNRGFNPQPDLDLYGLHYLQRVSDADPKPSKKVLPHGYSQTAGQALHIEPGLFMNVPAAIPGTTPGNMKTIVRLASIPHGVTVLMQGPNPGTKPTLGPPNIPALSPFTEFPPPPYPPHPALYPGLNPIPFPGLYTVPPQPLPVPPPPNPPGVGIQPITTAGAQHVVPEINIALDTLVPPSQSSGPFPESFQGFINDPNSVLRDAIADQEILGFIAINLTTDSLSTTGFPTLGVGSLYETVSNIPFLGVAAQSPTLPPGQAPATVAIQPDTTPNAFVYSASATFWIEWVRWEHGPRHHQPGHESEEYRAIREIEPFWPERTYLQLQYSQLVILVFNNILWPHVTVATMTLSDG